MQEKKEYLVLARKYRPLKLSDLIGQEEICAILEGALTFGRLAHAYLFSGTRGVGKTTLARILAKVVNCLLLNKQSFGDPCGKCENCKSIDNGSNIDVIELDAASRTGVNDVREIIENINYKPVSAKKKIYIIDEVHMLSKAAFNALLKTLEEPPSDVLFLLATTETEKIPVTIVSRCQHFNLKRIENKILSRHLVKISKIEGINLDQSSAEIISRSSEGSVRDALSILDNVIAIGKDIKKETINEVLGLSDLTKVLELFDLICKGDVIKSLKLVDLLYQNGASFEKITKDLINIIYLITRFKSYIDISEAGLNEYEINTYKNYSKTIDMDVLVRLWELTNKYLEELINSFNQKQSFEMIIIRLCYVSLMPTPFEAINEKNNKGNIKKELLSESIKPKTEESGNPEVNYFTNDNTALEKRKEINNESSKKTNNTFINSMLEDYELLVIKIEKKKELFTYHHLVNNFKLVSIKLPKNKSDTGILELKDIEKNRADKNFLWKVSQILKEITGSRWIVSLSNKEIYQTLAEVFNQRKRDKILRLSKKERIKKLLEIIPSSEIVSIEKIKEKPKIK